MLYKHDSSALADKGATFTVSEIKQQPSTWLKTFVKFFRIHNIK